MTFRRTLAGICVLCSLSWAGCATWRNVPTAPSRNSFVLGQLVIYSDFPVPQKHRLLDELVSQRMVLSTKLGLPLSDEPIHVYLFHDADRFKSFMRVQYPEFPDRRAFFVESDTRLMVYASWGDRVAEDLRHEVAHGYLHAVVPHLPLWLDEGLAEYFEVPHGSAGVNRPHVDQLAAALAQGWTPDLARLEQLRNAAEMTQFDYAESWAWVHWLIETTPENLQILRAQMQLLRRGDSAEPLSHQLRRMHRDDGRELAGHLAKLSQSLR